MSARSQSAAAPRLRAIYGDLMHAYGPQEWWPARTRFEVIVGAYLTQNTSWKAVERSITNLRRAGALSVSGMRSLPLARLRELIRPSGFYTRKAPALKAFIALLDDSFNGSLRRMAATTTDELRSRLLELPGVGQETADAILLYAFNHPVPVADEYLRRIAERHKLLEPLPVKNGDGYRQLGVLTRQAFQDDPDEDRAQLYNELHALVVAVGKAHCGRRARCEGCPLEKHLP